MDVTSTNRGRGQEVRRWNQGCDRHRAECGRTQTLEVRRDQEKNVYAKSSVVDGSHKATSIWAMPSIRPDDFPQQEGVRLRFSDPSKVDLKAPPTPKKANKWKSGGKVNGQHHSAESDSTNYADLSAPNSPKKAAGAPFSRPP